MELWVRVVQGEVMGAVMLGHMDWLLSSEGQFVMLGELREFDWTFLLGSFLHGPAVPRDVGGGLAHHPSSLQQFHHLHQVGIFSSFSGVFGGQLHHPIGGEAVRLPCASCLLVLVLLVL